jgi:RNA polymerase subunit RPABC4/transcription elongation factor Spt4
MATGVFQCRNCKEWISVGVNECRFCKSPITADVAQAVMLEQADQDRINRKNAYVRAMMIGGGMFVLGLVVTVGSIALATMSSSGGYYFVTYGLVVFGAINFFRGLIGYLNNRTPLVRA